MNDSNSLHWSFDYNYGAQNPQFAQELIGTLRGYDPEAAIRCTQTPQIITHVYNVLPNYWRGYSRGENTETLRIELPSSNGAKTTICGIIRQIREYNERRESTNAICCHDENYRPLRSNWSVDARNSAGDKYAQLTCTGYLTSDSEVRLRINGNPEIAGGAVGASVKLTCNWGTLDVIPTLARTIQASGDGVDIAVLEDLEQLRLKK